MRQTLVPGLATRDRGFDSVARWPYNQELALGGNQDGSMRYNVAQLLKGTTGSFRKYDLSEEIRNLDPELRPLRPLTG